MLGRDKSVLSTRLHWATGAPMRVRTEFIHQSQQGGSAVARFTDAETEALEVQERCISHISGG